ncbi:MAG: DUF47 family protein [Candidatus Undinarchaeales archaeon]|jgi:predicted phosphate transport protein (TIGR00153 family)|nr:DUF47 family protein [Candidatus Undinarchaeales archaeon]MDP7491688.1 DUF47 family protein [Candidatus Undinarchaeales archaeon]
MVLESAFFWMGGKKEARFTSMLDRHMDIAVEAVKELETATKGYVAREPDYTKHADRAVALESQADAIFDTLTERLAKSLLPASEKQDLMTIAQRLEHLIEHIEQAAKALLLANKIELPAELNDDILRLAAKTRECVESLRGAAEEHRDLTVLMKYAHRVSQAERDADEIKFDILSKVIERRNLDVTQEFFLRELIGRFEDITDMSDDAVDAFRIVSLKR